MKIERYAKKLLKNSVKFYKNSRLLSFIINMIKTERKNISLLRGYENAEISRHISNQISQKSVDSLIASAQKHFNLVSQFYKRKNKF